MTLTLFLFSLLGYVAFGTRRLKWPADHLPLVVVALWVSLLYGFAMGHALWLGAKLLLVGGWGLLAAQVIADRRQWREAVSAIATPGVVSFFTLAGLFAFQYHQGEFTNWDEFSHWGLVIKEMAASHALSGPDSAVVFKDYPPGSALFQYALVSVTGWSEGWAMVAQAIMAIAALPTLLTGATWRNGFRVATTIVLYAFMVVTFCHDFPSLYVDQLLGVLMAGALVMYATSEDKGAGAYLRLLPVLFALPIVKTPGMLLAIIVAVAVAIDALLGGARPSEGRGLTRLQRAALVCLLIVAPCAAYGGWKHHVAASHYAETFKLDAQVAETSPAAVAERRAVTVREFEKALSTRTIGNVNLRRLPFFTVLGSLPFLGVLLVGVGALQPSRESRVRFTAMHLVLAIGAAVYLGGLLWLYLTAFDAYEGPRLASFERYVGIYALAWLLVVIAHAARGFSEGPRRRVAAAGVLLLAVFVMFRAGQYVAIERLLAAAPSATPVRQHVQAQLPELAGAAGGPERCYVVWQNTDGLEFWMLRYELAPRLVVQATWKQEPWSLGAPYRPGDVWTQPLSPEAWSDLLLKGHYRYVFVGHADDRFRRQYGALFPKGGAWTTGLYRVNPAPGGMISLSAVRPDDQTAGR